MSHPVCSGGVGAMMLAPDGSGATIAGGRDGTLSTFNAQGGAGRGGDVWIGLGDGMGLTGMRWRYLHPSCAGFTRALR